PVVDSSLVVTTDWLAAHLKDPSVVVLEISLGSMGTPSTEHIPGATAVDYHDVIETVGGIAVELPPADRLVEVFAGAGVSSGSRVVLYGSLPPAVTRAFFALD